MAENKNIFMENIRSIILTAYDGQDTPRYDWNVAVDMWKQRHHELFKGVEATEIGRQRAEFIKYVDGKKINKFGDEAV